MQEPSPTAPGERIARIALLVLLGLAAGGLAAWLYRVYGFEPLEIKEPAIRGAKP
jgi:hypothetical protein